MWRMTTRADKKPTCDWVEICFFTDWRWDDFASLRWVSETFLFLACQPVDTRQLFNFCFSLNRKKGVKKNFRENVRKKHFVYQVKSRHHRDCWWNCVTMKPGMKQFTHCYKQWCRLRVHRFDFKMISRLMHCREWHRLQPIKLVTIKIRSLLSLTSTLKPWLNSIQETIDFNWSEWISSLKAKV